MKQHIPFVACLLFAFAAIYVACWFGFHVAPKRHNETVLLRKDKAVVSCEITDHRHCGVTLKCLDGTVMYCVTNVETKP